MAEKGWIGHSTLTAIANAIRAHTGDTALMLPGEMAQQIAGIQTGTKVYQTQMTANDTQLNFSFTHGLGKTPSVFILYTNGTHAGTSYSITYDVVGIYIAQFGAFRGYYNTGSNFDVSRSANADKPYQVETFNETTVAGTLVTRVGHTYEVVMY